MPPFIPRKRVRGQLSDGDGDGDEQKPSKQAKPSKLIKETEENKRTPSEPAKGHPPKTSRSQDRKKPRPASLKREDSHQRHVQAIIDDDTSSGLSSLSELSDVGFEDVPLAETQKVDQPSDEEEEDEDIEFEDVDTSHFTTSAAPVPNADLELTLTTDNRLHLTNPYGEKKGPSKIEKVVRHATHCMHVQALMWHNAVRNSWLCDPEVQGIMVSHLPPKVVEEIERWRHDSGLELKSIPSSKVRAKISPRGKRKGIKAVGKPTRDWGNAASQLEKGRVDLSHGDPLFRLMRVLIAWWKQRFRISAPGIRKIGYMALDRLDRNSKDLLNGRENPDLVGEKIRNLNQFRAHAMHCTGSRDVGAQLFTALLRGLGMEARMVANLQPLGFGWSKMEDADPEKHDKSSTGTSQVNGISTPNSKSGGTSVKATPSQRETQTAPSSARKYDEDASDSDELELAEVNSDNDSVVEILPTKPKKKSFDRDLEFAHYWTEVLSPVAQKYLAVDSVVKFIVATNRELVESFEPRGGKADKARQVMCYTIAFASDGTAKDVTVRYLKRQMLPGRTKGMRLPKEKVPIYNKHGKVKRHELYDWFRAVMRGYERGGKDQPITDVDEDENSTDLKPMKPEKKPVKEGEETLQYYKQSAEFVLVRHLKREEALLPDASPVKVFKGKGKGSEAIEENVYLRKDVVNVKSAETWHKQGRAPMEGEDPLKRVPYRAATTNRRRELAEAEAATGEKALQGLYSEDQTDWIIPPPIENGVIPKNAYGNIDLFAEHMCPEGAVHVPYRTSVKVCKRMGIDFAEAVVGFEFGHRMAVPVIQGVVIAEEYHDEVMDEVVKEEAEKARKEDEKRRKVATNMWRKMLMGMRIVAKIRKEYGEIGEDENPFGHAGKAREVDLDQSAAAVDEDIGGGFFPEGYEDDAEEGAGQASSFFPVVDNDSDEADGDDDALVVEHTISVEPREQVQEAEVDAELGVPPPSEMKLVQTELHELSPPAAASPEPGKRSSTKGKAKSKAKTKTESKTMSKTTSQVARTNRSTRGSRRRKIPSSSDDTDDGGSADQDSTSDFAA